MSLGGRGHLDIDTGDGKIWDAVADDTKQSRNSAASQLATTREEPVPKRVHDKVLNPTIPTTTVFGEQRVLNDDHGQGSSSQANQKLQVPQTPNRDSPNIGRKRVQNPALLRAAASSGHSAKMAQIFHDAQITLRNDLQFPVLAFGKRTRKSRLPVLQRQTTGGSIVCYAKEQNADQITSTAICTSKTASLTLDAQNKRHISTDRTTTPSKAITNKTPYETQDDLCSPTSDASRRQRRREPTCGSLSLGINEVPPHEETFVSKGSTRGRVLTKNPTPPNPGKTSSGFDIWDDGDDSELYFSQRSIALPTPTTSRMLFTPGANRANVDKWLEDMLSASPRKKWKVPGAPGFDSLQTRDQTPESRGASKAQETPQRPSYDEINMPETDMEPEGSDKENQKPPDGGATSEIIDAPQPVESLPLRDAVTPHKSRIPTWGEKAPTHLVGFPSSPPHHTVPRATFLGTQRRGKQVSRDTAPALLSDDGDVVKLSPDVDQYRKGNRPRRERCASYYDNDIIKSPKERGVLTESSMSRKLTRAMAFCEEAEDFEFTSIMPRV